MKDRKTILKNQIESFLKKEQLLKNEEYKKLEKPYLTKARKNFTVASLLLKISEEEDMKRILNLASDFEMYDWVIIVSYYAIYHASLSLCALKGYSTKDHNATLLILIREFYNNGLSKEEIETVGKTTIEKEDVLYYVQAKGKRNKASYSTQKLFDKQEAESLRLKAIAFVNKAREIVECQEPLIK